MACRGHEAEGVGAGGGLVDSGIDEARIDGPPEDGIALGETPGGLEVGKQEELESVSQAVPGTVPGSVVGARAAHAGMAAKKGRTRAR